MGFVPKKNEITFDVKPIGVGYRCEFCHKGEMEADASQPIIVNTSGMNMIKHYCNKCGAQLDLPKIYPYIEWERADKKEGENESD